MAEFPEPTEADQASALLDVLRSGYDAQLGEELELFDSVEEEREYLGDEAEAQDARIEHLRRVNAFLHRAQTEVFEGHPDTTAFFSELRERLTLDPEWLVATQLAEFGKTLAAKGSLNGVVEALRSDSDHMSGEFAHGVMLNVFDALGLHDAFYEREPMPIEENGRLGGCVSIQATDDLVVIFKDFPPTRGHDSLMTLSFAPVKPIDH